MAAVDGLEMAAAHAAKARTQVEAVLAKVVVQVAATLNRHLHAAVAHAPTIPLATTMHSLHGPMPIWEPTSDTATPSIATEATARVDNPTPCVPAWTAWPNAVAAAAVVDTVAAEAATVVAVAAVVAVVAAAAEATDHVALAALAVHSIANHSS